MTEDTQSPSEVSCATPGGEGDSPRTENGEPAPSSRARVAGFVVVFVVCVLALLTAYRYAIPTTANDWYLFQVANHTAALLRMVGDSSPVEDPSRLKEPPELVRARIKALEKGETPPESVPAPQNPVPPLTAWEAWHYRSMVTRYENPDRDVTGPLVSFVFKPGLTTRLRAVKKHEDAVKEGKLDARIEEVLPESETLSRVKPGALLDAPTQASLLDELAQERELVEAELEAARANNEPPHVIRGLLFPFTVVPDCGAIPSMSIFFAAVVAFPTRWWKRLAGVVVGLPILYGINCVRLMCLALVGAWDYGMGYGGKYFNFAHHYVWQGIYIVFVVAVWMAWVEFVVRGGEKWENRRASGA